MKSTGRIEDGKGIWRGFTSESDWQLYRAVGGSSAVPDAEGAALFQKTGLRALAAGVPEFLCADRAAKSFQSDSFQGGRPGQAKVQDFATTLLEHIRKNGGRTALNDKSPAEDIYAIFGVSKKTFKKAVGDLYKKHLIVLTEEGMRISD